MCIIHTIVGTAEQSEAANRSKSLLIKAANGLKWYVYEYKSHTIVGASEVRALQCVGARS